MEIKSQWIEAVKYRTSRRNYIDQSLDNIEAEKLKVLINKINEESGLNFQLIEDCSRLFKGFSASYGMIKGLNTCIALVANTKMDYFKTKVGYYGEILVLEATDMNLGTCWIGGTYNKEECKKYVDIKPNEELICVIAVGKVSEGKSMKEKFISKMNKGKKSPDQILLEKDSESIENWVKEGIEYVTQAPSALNKQPVGYAIKQDEVSAYVTSEKYGYEEIDLGISMLHFELGAISKNHRGSWNYINGEKIYK